MYKIEWQPKAYRQLNKIAEKKTKISILDAVDTLVNWPNCKQVKSLKNRNGYRIRVGRWRVLFDVAKKLKILKIEEVKKRDERTY
ncbi:MAG: type II toxin-antitoxin system RelE/ParE family toxin [Candidatus Marinimicrobia bacterium]|jgi:mRNA-degrading endonuclease RelE of RelBE toxin-antitoxin system|nr:type II toxin-antitoxin system RelE/ParE family toxin [Candidatus Neomarinimicrobiota bacterium]MBT7973586.1 type II toxin-antitoxin system RelE/ParE family toxin [Candidatus Neomarinimicrobiota bacterium]